LLSFNGQIINAIQAYGWLNSSAKLLNADASICSAYTKKTILEKIAINLPDNSKVRVLVRWELNDIICGASDLDAYLFCKKNGWEFYINNNSHVKIYHLPPSGILLGSANATNSGLGISNDPNLEAGTVVNSIPENIEFIDNLFRRSVLMTDELFEKILKCVSSVERISTHHSWPDSLFQEIKPQVTLKSEFLMSELLRSAGNAIVNKSQDFGPEELTDLSLLSITDMNYSIDYLALRLKRTHIFIWLNLLIDDLGGEIYFGRLTSELHSALVEDPMPYRSEIKSLVSNIYSWVILLGPNLTGLAVDQPNHSQRLFKI